MYCTYCNYENNAENKFCESCGKPVKGIVKSAPKNGSTNSISSGFVSAIFSKKGFQNILFLGLLILTVVFVSNLTSEILSGNFAFVGPSENDVKKALLPGFEYLGLANSYSTFKIKHKTKCEDLPPWVKGQRVEKIYIVEYELKTFGKDPYFGKSSLSYKDGEWSHWGGNCP